MGLRGVIQEALLNPIPIGTYRLVLGPIAPISHLTGDNGGRNDLANVFSHANKYPAH